MTIQVEYKKGYEQSKGKLIGALSIEDDPKMIHCQKVGKQQSDVSTDKLNNMWFVDDMLNFLKNDDLFRYKTIFRNYFFSVPFGKVYIQ